MVTDHDQKFNISDVSLIDIPKEYLDSLVTASYIAKVTGLSVASVRYMRRVGKLPYVLMPGGQYRYPPYIVSELMKKARVKVYEPKNVDPDYIPNDDDMGGVLSG
ncbi:MAG: DNA-binding protein [Actinobacteria bacterium]|nr:DNA-binding protein [Actinomycetota bacterium]